MRRTVLFILSTSYAGSHYLSLMLGSHSKAMHVGEVERLRKPRNAQLACVLCGPADRCPVFRGIRPDNIDQAYDVFFERFGSTAVVLVDNSKIVDASRVTLWAERFVGRRSYAIKCVHLIRDPRALVRRWTLEQSPFKKQLKERLKVLQALRVGGAPALLASAPYLAMYRWLAENTVITRFLARHRLDARVLTYEECAKDPGATVQGLMEWLALPYEPAQVQYWNFEHHGTQKLEYEWVKEKKVQFIDTRWKTFLPEQTSRNIVGHPLVQRYVSSLGLTLTEEGLAGGLQVAGQAPSGGPASLTPLGAAHRDDGFR